MKKIKLLPSVLMLALCIGILGIGIYAATPTNNVITGTITVNAANAGITVEVYKGTDTSVDPIGTDTGRATTLIELTGENAINIDASEAESLSEVEPAVYTIRLSTTSTNQFIVDTETIEWLDGTTATGTITDALKITKVHTPSATDDTTGLAYFTNEKPYIITCSINLTDLHEEDFTSDLNMTINVHKLSDWTAAGNTGINGIDYLHFGEYPQALAAEFASTSAITGYTATGTNFYGYSETDGKKEARAVYTKDGETDGTKYVCLTNVWKGEYDEDSGDQLIEDAANLYKIQPLKWRILSTTNGYSLMCDTIVEQVFFQQFYEYTNSDYYAKIDGVTSSYYANDYSVSTLRNYLIDTFQSGAFSDAELALLQEVEIKNDLASTGDTSNNYVTDTITKDKVYALSKADVINADYGFATSTGSSDTRVLTVTDYANATGASRNSSNFSGYWWLRSPDSSPAYSARCVYRDGFVRDDSVYHNSPGCVPALLLGL